MTKEEKSIAKWNFDRLKEARKYFEYADISQNILEQQKDDDLLILQDWFVELSGKLKPDDKRRDEVLLLIKSVWRIQSYCGTLETVCKSSTVLVSNYIKRIEELESELRIVSLKEKQNKSKYDSELSKLKERLEWVEKNNK